jgi:hypothetical protein
LEAIVKEATKLEGNLESIGLFHSASMGFVIAEYKL